MLRIVAVDPTVLFSRKDDALQNLVAVTVENRAGASMSQVGLTLHREGVPPFSATAREVPAGTSALDVFFPDSRQPCRARMEIAISGKATTAFEFDWIPRKHWRVHMVPISHHDLGYTGTIEEVYAFYRSLYDDVLRFCAKTEDWPEQAKYRYTVEGAWSLSDYVEHASPAKIRKLARYVQEGRIEIPALMGNEISNLCSHEELVRLLYPSFGLKRLLGGEICMGSITDIPGLSWGLPSILAGVGVKYFFAGLPKYFSWKNSETHGFWDQRAVLRSHGIPDAFYWEGPDRKKVLVYYQAGYGCWHPKSCNEIRSYLDYRLKEIQDRGCPFSVARYGNCVGDNTPADVTVSRLVREWNGKWAFPALHVSTNTLFFRDLETQCNDVRTFRGDLPDTDYVVGATSTARETSLNRTTHERLPAAERFSAVAFKRRKDREQKVARAYMDMMLFDEHTWGMCQPAGHRQEFAVHEKTAYAYRAAGAAQEVLRDSMKAIAGSVRRDRNDDHVVVFNPLSFERTDLARIDGRIMDLADLTHLNEFARTEPFRVVDAETGGEMPYQLVERVSHQAPVPHAAAMLSISHADHPGMEHELVFRAVDVPSVGYRSFRIEAAETTPTFATSLILSDHSIENEFYKIALDPQTGAVASLFDKETGRELVDTSAPHSFGQFLVRQAASGEVFVPERMAVSRGEAGPLLATLIRSGCTFAFPQVRQEITLYDRIKRIDFNARVLKDTTPEVEAYFAFPFAVDDADFTFEAPASVMKPFRDQFPGSNTNYYAMQHWAEACDGGFSAVFAPIDAHLVELGGLWPCHVSQAHHGVKPHDFNVPYATPDQMTKGHFYSFALMSNFRTNFTPVQHGEYLFRYSISSHAGNWQSGYPRNFGWACANPLSAVVARGKSKGRRSATDSFCRVAPANVILTALKHAEHGNGYVLRLMETEGRNSTASVRLSTRNITSATLTNLVEEDMQPLDCAAGTVTVPLEPFGIATVRVMQEVC